MRRKRLIVLGPLPPPYHGVAVSTSLVLANAVLAKRFRIEHLDTSDRRPIDNLGKWDWENLRTGLSALARLQSLLRGAKGVVYLPLSENAGGFIRDSLYVWSAQLRGWKVAVHIRNSLFRQFYSSQPALLRWWIRMTMKQMTGVAVLGERLRPLMDGFVSQDRVAVVPNGTPAFEGPVRTREDNLVIYLSNLSRKKGADHAVRAAQIIAERNPQSRFVFAGDWESKAFENEVRALAFGLEDRLDFPGPVAGLPKDELVATASVLLFPVAWGEGHPRILLEAMAAGLPVVTTDRSTIAETLGDGEGGFVVADPIPAELAEKVLTLLGDRSLRERMGARANQRWLLRFTQDEADHTIADWLSSVATHG
jgi:glycosyltransferase involved in cell wall biosynthesis